MRSAKDGDSRELTINQDWNCFSYDIVVPDVYNDVWTTCVDGTCNNGSTACTAETGYFDYACVINPYVTAFEAGNSINDTIKNILKELNSFSHDIMDLQLVSLSKNSHNDPTKAS